MVSDAYEACLRRVHAVYARVMRLLPCCGDGSHRRRWSPTAPQEEFAVATRDGTSAVRYVGPLRMVVAVGNVERSPPRRRWPLYVPSLLCLPQMGAGPSGVCLVAQKSFGWILSTLPVRRVRGPRDTLDVRLFHAVDRPYDVNRGVGGKGRCEKEVMSQWLGVSAHHRTHRPV
jgi:hypothetical protein